MIKELIVSAISFFAFTLHAITGFGGNIVVFPVLTALFGTMTARVILNLVAWVSSISVTADCYKDIDYKELKTILIWMGSGLIVGTLLIPYIKSETILMLIYGVIIMAVAIYKLLAKKEVNFKKPVLYLILVLAGIIQALFVSGGAFLVIYCTQILKEKKAFRATFTMVWLCVYTVMFIWQLIRGVYTSEIIRMAIFGAVPVVLASWLGSRITARINQKVFMLIVYIFILLVGMSITWNSLKKII